MAEQKQRASGTLPKNIRQIGTSIGSTRVYLEDYVYTYLHTQEEQESWLHRGFILLGRAEKGKDYTRYFISGLIRVADTFFKDHILEFTDETWASIYKEMKQYYDNLEIVGWGQDVGNAPAGLAAELERTHQQNFNIQKNVLFLLDQVEKEDAFYIFEKNMLQRREGYYVYYEKNPQMQEYMVQKKESQELNIPPDEIKEPLVHNYRETLLQKKAQLSERKWNGVLYTTSLLLVLSVCVLGVSTVNNVEKMQDLESTVNQISGQGGQAGVRTLDVPVISANVQEVDGPGLDAASSKPSGDKTSGTKTSDNKTSDNKTSGNQAFGTDGQESANGSSGNGQETANGNSASGQEAANGSSDNGQGIDSGISGSNGQGAPSGASKRTQAKGSEKNTTENSGQESESVGSEETAALSEAQTSLLQGYYIVKKGDSLVGISKKIYGTAAKARRICELNGIEDMDMIYAGQKLELP